MRRPVLVLVLAAAGLALTPARAAADLTFFLGATSKPEARSARGFALGVNLLVVGFEFEYSHTREDEAGIAPGLTTSMINGLIMTPTSGMQLYATAGGGFYRERLLEERETSFGTNVGGGVKIGLIGPLRLRIDYRIYNLRGNPRYKTPQRFYAGANIAF